jgi:hypothetical protein
MDHNPGGEDKEFGKAVGLHSKFLSEHPVTGPALRFLDRYKAEKERRKK